MYQERYVRYPDIEWKYGIVLLHCISSKIDVFNCNKNLRTFMKLVQIWQKGMLSKITPNDTIVCRNNSGYESLESLIHTVIYY